MTPPDIRDLVGRLEPLLGPVAGEPVPLSGGITNRNYRVTFGDSEHVVRLPGKDTALLGIDRASERLANETAARLGIAPAVTAAIDECLVTRFVACEPVSPADLSAAVGEVGKELRAFHDSGLQLPTRFHVPAIVDSYAVLVHEHGRTLPDAYPAARVIALRIAAAMPAADPVPCHNDLLPGNLIRAGERILVVDWEYAGMGDAWFDLGNLAINGDLDEAAEERLLASYLGYEPRDGDRARVRLMRVMSDAREAVWGVAQLAISDIEFDFAAYAQEHFERLAESAADPRFEEWLLAAAA